MTVSGKQANSAPARLLSGYRALDLAGQMGVYCGNLMADMGADVIKVEPLTDPAITGTREESSGGPRKTIKPGLLTAATERPPVLRPWRRQGSAARPHSSVAGRGKPPPGPACP